METAIRVPLSERINFRLIGFGMAMLLLLGYPMYIYLESAITGGVRDIGNGVKFVDLKAMSSFPFDGTNGKIDDVPERWRELNGQKVLLEGEMWAPNAAGAYVPEFELVYSIAKCCFSGPPQIQHFVHATPTNGQPLPFYSGLVRVWGTLKVEVTRDEEANRVTRVYHLSVEKIEPVS
jgi:hypothetical protein